MSAEASGYVWKHSPYRGATFVVHLAIADTVNDLHDEQFWMSVSRVAKKARLSPNKARDAIHKLVREGYLELVREAELAEYRPNTYRFLFKGAPAAVQAPPPAEQAAPHTVGGATTVRVVGLPPPVGESTPVAGARSQVGSQVVDPKRRRDTRGWRRVPPTETLTPDRQRMAWEVNSLPTAVAVSEWAAFTDHEYASPRTNVDAAWRNWCRKVKRKPLPAPPPAPGKREAGSGDQAKGDLVRLGTILKEVGL